MLRECLETVMSACESFSVRLEPFPEPEPLYVAKPVWDNGIDYDIPTFIRRGQNRGRRYSRSALGRRPRPSNHGFQQIRGV